MTSAFAVASGITALAVIVWGGAVVLRSNEVFLLEVRERQVLMIRGGLSPTVQRALVEVLRSFSGPAARVRGVRRDGATVLEIRGLHADLAQRLRNVFAAKGGTRSPWPPISRKRSRNWGQRLGWASLAFYIDARTVRRAAPPLRRVK